MSIADNMKTIADAARILVESDNTNSHQSIIHWQKGEPKKSGSYLITTSNGKVFADYWRVYPNRCDWDYRNKFDVKAWCKLSDIEPYIGKEK